MSLSSCHCDNLFSGFRFKDIKKAEPPDARGVYVLRVCQRGQEPAVVFKQVKEFVGSVKWSGLEKKVLDRVERIKKIDGCPTIYIGRAGRQKGGRHTLAKRYRNFFGGHTAMFPVWALLYSGWELEYGWLEKENPEFTEGELKKKYKNTHQGRLPALVKK